MSKPDHSLVITAHIELFYDKKIMKTRKDISTKNLGIA